MTENKAWNIIIDNQYCPWEDNHNEYCNNPANIDNSDYNCNKITCPLKEE
ncbi:hypothetical protein LCGC14_1642260 [marine sediment metagenome]|uniref:Uncharacterized protein n=1 Tax=marine sediment metagenome TaxID=412755 RepID=A0A0F9KF27_9ZZZZ